MGHSWDPVLLPPGYAWGFTGGPAFDTRIRRNDGFGENRVQVLDEPVWRWQALRKNFGPDADVDVLLRWFLARRGALYGFLFLDPRDFSTAADGRSAPSSLDQVIGYGDGVTTRFKLRKQYPDPGGMTGRDFPRRVVPLLGTASAAVARVIGVEPGASIDPAVAIDGSPVSPPVWFPETFEVEFGSAPAIGEQITWGGYFVTPVRFDEQTDKQFDAVMTGFASDEAAFGIESIQFDDPVPLVPGGSPYGVQTLVAGNNDLKRFCFLVESTIVDNCTVYLPDLDNYPTGGPHHMIVAGGSGGITVRDQFGNVVGSGSLASGARRWLFVREDSEGIRAPYLL